MGNATSFPSSAAHKSHNRLSKPKTNSNSPFPGSKSEFDSPDSTPTKYGSFESSDATVRTSLDDCRSRQDARDFIQSQVWGSQAFGSKEMTVGETEEDSNDGLGELASTVRDRLSSLSGAGSITTQVASARGSTPRLNSLPSSKLSFVPETEAVDLEVAITILQELKKTASPADLVALHKALLPSRPSEVSLASAPARAEGPQSRSKTSLMRRRSLATPGLATRGGPESDILRKPSPNQDEEIQAGQIWKMEMFGTSPLARLASLEVDESGRTTPTPRTQTPGEMDYSHLGNLQLGSLVVTNGAASPAPSVATKRLQTPRSMAELSQEEDYFTASEGRSSPEELVRHPPPPPCAHMRSKSSVPALASPGPRPSRNPAGTENDKLPPRSDSPLKQERKLEDFMDNSDDLPPPQKPFAPREQNSRAASLASEYIAEIASSPFTSAFDDEQSSNEGISMPRSPGNKGYRDEAFRILEGTMFSDTPIQESHAAPQVGKGRSTRERPSQVKKDSGYSSGASLAALQTTPESEKEEQSAIPEAKSLTPPSKEEARSSMDVESLYTFEQMVAMSRIEKPVVLKKAETPETPKPSKAEIKAEKKAEKRSKSRSRSKSRGRSVEPEDEDKADERRRSKSKTRRFSLGRRSKSCTRKVSDANRRSMPTYSSAEAVPTLSSFQSPTSVYVVSSNPKEAINVFESSPKVAEPSKTKKLQKRRPNSEQILVVQGNRPITAGSVPDIPRGLEREFTQRISNSPGMEHLDRTFASVAHTDNAACAASTIDNVSIRFPSPEPESETRPNPRRRLSKSRDRNSDARPPTPPPHRHLHSLSVRKREKRSDETQPKDYDEEDSIEIADFGTVVQSLGGSPYDIALGGMKPRSRNALATHPHQLSTKLPLVRRESDMDSATAAELARAKSRDRASAMQAQAQALNARRRSYHENDLEKGEAEVISRHRRSKSMYDDAPPVPELPSQRRSLMRACSAKTTMDLLAEAEAEEANWTPGVESDEEIVEPEVRPALQARSPTSSGSKTRYYASLKAQQVQVPHPMQARTVTTHTPVVTTTTTTTSTGSNSVTTMTGSTSDWEASARLWRARRNSISENIGKPAEAAELSSDNPARPKLFSTESSNLHAEVIKPPPRSTSPNVAALAKHFEQPQQPQNQRPPPVPTHTSLSPSLAPIGPKNTSGRPQPKYRTYTTPKPSALGTSILSSTTVPSTNSTAKRSSSGPRVPIDRYDGGFDYGYEHGFGVNGSAGTRAGASKASRKSQGFAQSWGVDLSDVPVFVTKVQHA